MEWENFPTTTWPRLSASFFVSAAEKYIEGVPLLRLANPMFSIFSGSNGWCPFECAFSRTKSAMDFVPSDGWTFGDPDELLTFG